MSEHDDDLEPEVQEDAEVETAAFPAIEDDINDAAADAGPEDEELDLDEDETEL